MSHNQLGNVRCVREAAAPNVTQTTPADEAYILSDEIDIMVSFSTGMDVETITVSDTGQCTGSIQLSSDGFSTCTALENLSSADGGKTFSFAPKDGLVTGNHKIKVTTAVQDQSGNALAMVYTHYMGFEYADYVDNGDATITDLASGLMWE